MFFFVGRPDSESFGHENELEGLLARLALRLDPVQPTPWGNSAAKLVTQQDQELSGTISDEVFNAFQRNYVQHLQQIVVSDASGGTALRAVAQPFSFALEQLPDPELSLLQGVLHKLGGKKEAKNWKQRFFVLQNKTNGFVIAALHDTTALSRPLTPAACSLLLRIPPPLAPACQVRHALLARRKNPQHGQRSEAQG